MTRGSCPPGSMWPLMKNVGVDFTPSIAPRPASFFTSSSAPAYCASKSVIPATSCAAALTSLGRQERRLVAKSQCSSFSAEPSFFRRAMTTATAASQAAGWTGPGRALHSGSSGKCFSTNLNCAGLGPLREQRSVRLVGLPARRALVVVELDHQHLCAVGRDRDVHLGLHVAPLLELGLLLCRSAAGIQRAPAPRPGPRPAPSGRAAMTLDRADDEQRGDRQRRRTRDERPDIRGRRARQCRHRELTWRRRK